MPNIFEIIATSAKVENMLLSMAQTFTLSMNLITLKTKKAQD